MKKLLLALTVSVLFVGCSTSSSYRGGTSDQFYNNATHGTGSSVGPNRASDIPSKGDAARDLRGDTGMPE